MTVFNSESHQSENVASPAPQPNPLDGVTIAPGSLSAVERLDNETRAEILGNLQRSSQHDLERKSSLSPEHIIQALKDAVDIEIWELNSSTAEFHFNKGAGTHYSLYLDIYSDYSDPVSCRFDSHESTSDRYLQSASDYTKLIAYLEEAYASNPVMVVFLARFKDILGERESFRQITANPESSPAEMISAINALSDKIMPTLDASQTFEPRVYLNSVDRHGRYFGDGGGLGHDAHPVISSAFAAYGRIGVNSSLAAWVGGPAGISGLFNAIERSGFIPITFKELALFDLHHGGGADLEILPAGNSDGTIDPNHIVLDVDVLGEKGREQKKFKISLPEGTIKLPDAGMKLANVLGKTLASQVIHQEYHNG